MIKLAHLFFPPKCIACGELLPRELFSRSFCAECAEKWELAKKSCRAQNNGRPVKEIESFDEGGAPELVPYSFIYTPGKRKNPENALILRLKDFGDKRCVSRVATEISEIIAEDIAVITKNGARHGDALITWIPRRRTSVKRFGFDHMERVAMALSKKLAIPAVPLLKRRAFAHEQKHLGGKERRINAERSMMFAGRTPLNGKIVLLVDDIVTTGASLGAASKLLRDAGADRVIPVALSATERPIDAGKRRIEDNFNIIKKNNR
ncbi:MAG: ComF family protein [Clostridia bacterium]|nr:ComF family protein [Clostridia bacterium]